MTKRVLALVLVLLMIVPIAVSCKKKGGEGEGTQAPIGDNIEGWTYLEDDVPEDLRFDGETFSILFREERPYWEEFGVEEDSEVVLEHATYQRNYMLKERFGIELDLQPTTGHWPNAGQMMSKINSSVKTSNAAWDAVAGVANSLAAEALKGTFMDLHAVEYLNLEKEYWNQSVVEEFTIDNHLYFITGDISPMLIGQSVVMFENLKVAEDWDIPNCYGLVANGKWDQANFLKICKFVNDSEAVTKQELGYTYGLIFPLNAQVDAYYASWDIDTTEINDAGELVLALDKNELSTAYDALYKMLVQTPQVFKGGSASENIGTPYSDDIATNFMESFKQNQALFTPNRLYLTTTLLTDMEEEYAILPYPMLTKAQGEYRTYSWDQYSMIAIPKDVADPSFAGAVLEVMARLSQNHVTPAYYETALKSRYAPNEESSMMLDYITENIIIEVSYLNGSTGLTYFLRDTIKTSIVNKANAIGNAYDSKVDSWRTAIEKTYNSYREVA